MKKVLAALTVISALFFLNACTESSDLQTSILIENPEITMNIESFEIAPEDVKRKLTTDSDFHLIDVRTPDERNTIHINGNIEYINSIDVEAGNISFDNYDKNDEIVVYCRSGNRSERVYNVMKNLGFTNVKSMAGGINEWVSLGYNTCSEVNNTC